MFSKFSLLLLAALIGGCTDSNSGNNGRGGDGTTDDTTDNEKTGTASLLFTVSVMGQIEPCRINIACDGADPLAVSSNEIAEVDAPVSCMISPGLSDYTEEFGYPIHLDEDGSYWAAAPISLELEPDEEILGTFSTFKVFEPGIYACSYDEYELDESRSDMKGEFRWTVNLDEQFIEVDRNGVVVANDNPNFDLVGGMDDTIGAVDDKLVLESDNDEWEHYITGSSIENKSFSFTVVDFLFDFVADVRCELD